MTTKPSETRLALLYARISKTDDNTPKVQNQLANLRELAHEKALTIAAEYEDDGLSASKVNNRPGFDRLLADLARYPGAVILATEEARLSRNPQEKLALQVQCASYGVTWLTMRDGAVDPAEAAGEFMSTIRGAVDRFEGRRKAERQAQTNADNRAVGKQYTNCVRAFGWSADRVTLDEAEAELVHRGTRAVLSGASLHSVLTMFRESGLKPRRGGNWTNLAVRRVLTRYRNAAVMTFNEVPTDDPATWEPIVTRDEIEGVRDILLSKNGTRQTVKHLLSSLALCACGSYMVSATMNGVTNYVCAARRLRTVAPEEKHTSIRADHLNAAARAAVIDTYLFTPRASTAGDTEAHKLSELHTELRKVRDAQAALLDLHLDGQVAKTVFVKKNRALVDHEAQLLLSIGQAASASAHAAMLTETRRLLFSARSINLRDAAAAKAELAEVFDRLDLDDQRRLVAATVRIVVYPGRGMGRVSIVGDGLPAEEDEQLDEMVAL